MCVWESSLGVFFPSSVYQMHTNLLRGEKHHLKNTSLHVLLQHIYNIHSVSTISFHKADYQSRHPVLNEPDDNNNSIFTPELNWWCIFHSSVIKGEEKKSVLIISQYHLQWNCLQAWSYFHSTFEPWNYLFSAISDDDFITCKFKVFKAHVACTATTQHWETQKFTSSVSDFKLIKVAHFLMKLMLV